MSPSLSVLPNEVLGNVFGWLPRRDLAEVSLMCQTWRVLAFRYLYMTVHISRKSHLEVLATRVAQDNGHGSLSIVAHLRRFNIDSYTQHQEDRITEDSLVHLEALVPRLVKLKYLGWDFPFEFDVKYLRLFQAQSPMLEGVELSIPRARRQQYTLFFNFSNLLNIDLTLPSIVFTSITRDMEYLPPLTRLLTSSPGLVSLTLENSPLAPISTVNVISSLGSAWVFPGLRVFRIPWASDEYYPEVDNSDWDGFFTPPKRDSHPLRAFLLRHQRIEDLALGWSPGKSYVGVIDPHDIVQILPSLKRFEGPAFLCNALTKSDIAQNLESLAIVDMTFVGQTDWLHLMGDGMKSMPKLRSLDIRAHDLDDILDPLILNEFILAAPNIEKLECRLVVNDFTAVLVAISHLPKLRELVVDGQSWVAAALDQEYEENPSHEDWKDTISRISKRCRLLESFRSVDGWTGSIIWQIVRDKEGSLCEVVNIG